MEGSTWSLKKIGPEVSKEKLFKGVDRRDRQQVITIVHPEQSSGELRSDGDIVSASTHLSIHPKPLGGF